MFPPQQWALCYEGVEGNTFERSEGGWMGGRSPRSNGQNCDGSLGLEEERGQVHQWELVAS